MLKLASLIPLYVMAISHIEAATLHVPAGGSLQAALDAAQPGDTITLDPGATYIGNFILRNKGTSTSVITIRSSALSMLPADTRVTPKQAQYMPRLTPPNDAHVFSAATGAHHYRLVGLEIASKPGLYNYGLVVLGAATEKSTSELPHNIEIDRCYIHGDPKDGGKRGISLNSGLANITNSWFSEFKSTWQDTQAIGGWNGTGPYLIQNNHLEATGEAVAFGGAIPTISGVIPSDIYIFGNHFYKPLSWKKDHSSYAGVAWMVKNHLEFKVGRRIWVLGNVFENVWQADQYGFAMQFTVRTENGRVMWNVIEDLVFSNNIVRGAAGGINILGKDDYNKKGAVRRVTISNNLFEDINHRNWGGYGRFLQVLNGTEGLRVDHNTVLQTGSMLTMSGVTTGFTYTNNITAEASYLFTGGTNNAANSLPQLAPGYVFRRNLVTGGVSSMWPADNYFPPSIASIPFVDVFNGNYTLQLSCPYAKAGADGKAIGVNMMMLYAAKSAGGMN